VEGTFIARYAQRRPLSNPMEYGDRGAVEKAPRRNLASLLGNPGTIDRYRSILGRGFFNSPTEPESTGRMQRAS